MIKKVILLFFILFNIIFLTYSENLIDLTGDMFFYIPGEEHITDYQNFYDYLKQWDENKIIVSDEKLLKFYKDFAGQKTLHSLLFEAFLRQTKNNNIRRQVLLMIMGNKFDDVFSKVLIRLYSSREKITKKGVISIYQYNYKNEYFDENINMFIQTEKLIFDREFGLMLFENPWNNLSFKDKEKPDNSSDSFFLICGGGTNSMMINFNKRINIKFEDFKIKEIENNYYLSRYQNWEIREIEITGILKKSNADKIFIGIGTGEEVFPEIKSATFAVYLFNEKLERGYSVSYYMNFSKINNNYEMRNRIWNQLLMQLMFCYINVK